MASPGEPRGPKMSKLYEGQRLGDTGLPTNRVHHAVPKDCSRAQEAEEALTRPTNTDSPGAGWHYP